MKVFWCDHCGQLVFFENSQCTACQHSLVFVPDDLEMKAFDFAALGTAAGPVDAEGRWNLCDNYRLNNVCNWAVAVEDGNGLCRACRLTTVIPNLSVPENVTAWFRLEGAKRRLLHSFLALGLPFDGMDEGAASGRLAFDFLADPVPGGPPVLTGHADGRIVINIAEADDAERERRRNLLREPYRTVLGHFRHESGHFYWDRLIRDTPRIEEFRQLFGDERNDYDVALQAYYAAPRADWQTQFVSAYASAHPWEDWAESWAHYLHIRDVVETAGYAGLKLRPKVKDAPRLSVRLPEDHEASFDRLIADWFPLTYVINNLNRGLGLMDGYPFVLSPAAVEKLRFIHETIRDFVAERTQAAGAT